MESAVSWEAWRAVPDHHHSLTPAHRALSVRRFLFVGARGLTMAFRSVTHSLARSLTGLHTYTPTLCAACILASGGCCHQRLLPCGLLTQQKFSEPTPTKKRSAWSLLVRCLPGTSVIMQTYSFRSICLDSMQQRRKTTSPQSTKKNYV